jgi:adenine deaminase
MKSFKISGNLVDIIAERIFPATITIDNGEIFEISENSNTYEQFILPGLIDSHVHIESSMMPPSEFATKAVLHGTVATVSDPHEIANVLGIEGVKYMINNGKKVPFKFYFGAPSCVPATDFESSGGKIDTDDIKELLNMPEIKYLSEMMNYPGVFFEVPDVLDKIRYSHQVRKPIDGHIPGATGQWLTKYVTAGISTDHECFTLEEAIEKISLGMKILIREGSAAKNFEALAELIDSHTEMVMLCSDDKHPDDLANCHINDLVKRALDRGYDLFKVLKVAVLNPKRHYNLNVGILQLGDPADLIVIDNLQDFNIIQTYIDGILVADGDRNLINRIEPEIVNNFNLDYVEPDDFRIEPKSEKIKVIEVIDGQLITNQLICKAEIKNNNVIADVANDILKIAVINRYGNSIPALGFIKNIGIKKGAIATSVGHDSHNIIAVGTSDDALAIAVNSIITNKGGMSVFDGSQTEILPLPIAGIMSNLNADLLSYKYRDIENKAKALGSELHSPFMTMSFMALLVIPKLKLSDKGLFDGEKFEFTDLFV